MRDACKKPPLFVVIIHYFLQNFRLSLFCYMNFNMEAKINQSIIPMIWFDNEAEEAAKFYSSAFPHCKILRTTRYVKEGQEIHGRSEGSVMTIDFEIEGYKISALNGGPIFKVNPSVSFFVTYEDKEQVKSVWEVLADGAKILMPFQQYPWSERYGWLQDKFGVSWQIGQSRREDDANQPVIPAIMFVGEQCGKAQAAIDLYTSIFKNSGISGVLHYGENELPDKAGTVKYAQFKLNGQMFIAMDSAMEHAFSFNEAMSFMVLCGTQQEVDYYWEALGKGGDPNAQVCGWLKDRFGLSWQVVPSIMDEMLQSGDREKAERVTKAFMKMKKFDIAQLQRAFDGAP